MDKSHEGGDSFLTSEGDASEAFELVGEALDLMALFVEAPVDGLLGGTAGVGLDLCVRPRLSAMKARNGSAS